MRRGGVCPAEPLGLKLHTGEDAVQQAGEEGVQVLGPYAAQLGRAPVELGDDAVLAEHPEVVRRGGLGDREVEAGAGLFVGGARQLAHDPQPDRVGQRVEHSFDADLLARGVGEHTSGVRRHGGSTSYRGLHCTRAVVVLSTSRRHEADTRAAVRPPAELLQGQQPHGESGPYEVVHHAA